MTERSEAFAASAATRYDRRDFTLEIGPAGWGLAELSTLVKDALAMRQEERHERATRNKCRQDDVTDSPPDADTESSTFDPKKDQARGCQEQDIEGEEPRCVISLERVPPEVDGPANWSGLEVAQGLRPGQEERNDADSRIDMPKIHGQILADQSDRMRELASPASLAILCCARSRASIEAIARI